MCYIFPFKWSPNSGSIVGAYCRPMDAIFTRVNQDPLHTGIQSSIDRIEPGNNFACTDNGNYAHKDTNLTRVFVYCIISRAGYVITAI